MGRISRCRMCGEMFLGKSWAEPHCPKCRAAEQQKAVRHPPCSQCGNPGVSTYKGVPVCLECWHKARARDAEAGQ